MAKRRPPPATVDTHTGEIIEPPRQLSPEEEADQLQAIKRQEKIVDLAERNMDAARTAASKAREHFDECVSKLRALIRGEWQEGLPFGEEGGD